MTKRSMQDIEDEYYKKGLRGKKLKNILKKDKEFQQIFKERLKKRTKNIKFLQGEKEKYYLSIDKDIEILSKIHQIEKWNNLSGEEKMIVTLIRTQLQTDWRDPLVVILDEFLNNKNLPSEERLKKVIEKSEKEFWTPEIS